MGDDVGPSSCIYWFLHLNSFLYIKKCIFFMNNLASNLAQQTYGSLTVRHTVPSNLISHLFCRFILGCDELQSQEHCGVEYRQYLT
jgi:hypothetical protein